MIPRRIFQFAHERRSIPPECASCLATVEAFAEQAGYEYRLLDLADLPALDAYRNDDHVAALLRSSPDLGALTNLARNMLLAEEGGWWLDWDLRVMQPETLASWLEQHEDFEWSGIIDHETLVVANEFQGGAPGNPINSGFLQWLAPYVPQGFRHWSGPHSFTDYLRGLCFVDHRYRLVPVRHTFQATYREVKEGTQPSLSDPRPLYHHWVHAWIDNEFDLAAWLAAHPPGRG